MLTRRQALYGMGASLGSVAFTALLQGAAPRPRTGHHPARAKRVIFLMMEGGPSHIDTFDPKPALDALHLRELTRDDRMLSAMAGGRRYYVRSPFRFRKCGRSGADMATNWEHLARVA